MKLIKLRGQSVEVCASETIKTLGLYAIGTLHVLYERFHEIIKTQSHITLPFHVTIAVCLLLSTG